MRRLNESLKADRKTASTAALFTDGNADGCLDTFPNVSLERPGGKNNGGSALVLRGRYVYFVRVLALAKPCKVNSSTRP